MNLLAGVFSLFAAAGACIAQGTITYLWDINDTGSNTYLYAGEPSINFKLYALMEPERFAFAGSIYEIRGGGEFSSGGTVTSYDNKLDQLTDDGDLQPNNDILDIQSFQLPDFFWGQTDKSNPILLYEIDWEVDSFFMEATLTTANHLNNSVYTDSFGTSIEYEAVTTTARVIVPGPGPGVVLLAAASLNLLPRRRPG